MYINLCFWHLMKVPNTKQVQYQSLQVYPSNFPLVDLFLVTPKPKHAWCSKQWDLSFVASQSKNQTNFPQTEPVFHQNGTILSQRLPKTEPVLPQNGACFSQHGTGFSRNQSTFFRKNGTCLYQCFFPKTEFHKTGGRFLQSWSQNRWPIDPKSVTDFHKVGFWFSQSRWQISTKSVEKTLVGYSLFSAEPSHSFPKTEPVFLNPWQIPKMHHSSFLHKKKHVCREIASVLQSFISKFVFLKPN